LTYHANTERFPILVILTPSEAETGRTCFFLLDFPKSLSEVEGNLLTKR